MSKLRTYLNLSNKSLNENELIFNILKQKDLKYLNLSKNSVNDEVLNIIAKHCKNLKILILHFCTDFTIKGINNILINCSKLDIIHAHDTIIDKKFLKNINIHKRQKVYWNI